MLNFILHPYEMSTTYDQVHFLVVVSLLHLLINACMRELFGIPLEFPWLALLWVLLLFLDQPIWFASTKHLKCHSDHHFYVSLPSTTLGLPTHRRQAPILGRSDLSPKNHSWYSLEITWLIDPSDGLNLMSNHESFSKPFSFYLFKSFSFYQMVSINL